MAFVRIAVTFAFITSALASTSECVDRSCPQEGTQKPARGMMQSVARRGHSHEDDKEMDSSNDAPTVTQWGCRYLRRTSDRNEMGGYPTPRYQMCGTDKCESEDMTSLGCDVTSPLCEGASGWGWVRRSTSEVRKQCTANDLCAGYSKDLYWGKIQPLYKVTGVDNGVGKFMYYYWGDIGEDTFVKYCQACTVCPEGKELQACSLEADAICDGEATPDDQADPSVNAPHPDIDLWPQLGLGNRKCAEDGCGLAGHHTGIGYANCTEGMKVRDLSECQAAAVSAGHEFYQYVSVEGKKFCHTTATCDNPITDTKWDWKIYSPTACGACTTCLINDECKEGFSKNKCKKKDGFWCERPESNACGSCIGCFKDEKCMTSWSGYKCGKRDGIWCEASTPEPTPAPGTTTSACDKKTTKQCNKIIGKKGLKKTCKKKKCAKCQNVCGALLLEGDLTDHDDPVDHDDDDEAPGESWDDA